ncbi:hypothetical protein JIN85_05020 [Luteolibacter pohnpeiensis]|uniref:Protein kinase domain-containing protein n=1 Tax=Luteolibacter pohnpeiensis TaxID=454153 RepID=A0A934SAG4_9BACT|nr:protein kinase [Luteolibacter pohnpeiensis]MBK1881763.1 hypothetical protein [Luteolibacter pohnpeiensis]
MEQPRIRGLTIKRFIGSGGCGSVYLAEDGNSVPLAVKELSSMSINRALLKRATDRLADGGWPDGVMQVNDSDFQGSPCFMVTAWHGVEGDVPFNLQQQLEDYPGENSWPLVRGISKALCAMHSKRVAHGNLKPGNVFFDGARNVLLTDWALGNMPGAVHLEFTDALLYQPPEQLRHADGYLQEAGYRWDVFAFGTLAYRVLTGEFPRCNEIFQRVAPGPGEVRKPGINADLPKIARNLESHPEVTWPHPPANDLEAGYREWIDRCLSLDPANRPSSMIELEAGFEAVDTRITAEEERASLLDHRRRSEHRTSRAYFIAAMMAVVALIFGALWHLKESQIQRKKLQTDAEISKLTQERDEAVVARTQALRDESEAAEKLNYQKNLGLARLEASRLIGDRLFSWAMEKGYRRLPPLDGRELRLKQLEKYFEDFIARTADVSDLEDERRRVKLQLAEVSIAEGDVEKSIVNLEKAVGAYEKMPREPEHSLRLGRDRLLLALLLQSARDARAGDAFVKARSALDAVPATDVDADNLDQMKAILDFHEAKLLSADHEDPKALEQLMRATQTLNRLADERPDAAVLRSELAVCYLSSATILDGMGNLGDAREVRILAAAEYQKLLKNNPDDPGLRFELAGCYAAMADSALLSGDTGAADVQSKRAMDILEKLVSEQPDNVKAISRLGVQIGLRAGLLRDRGQAVAALASFEEGIRLLEGVRASDPDNATAAYHLALLWWQKGRMLGIEGDVDHEIELITVANSLLEKLEGNIKPDGPPIERIQRSRAYLLGDLGHAQQLDRKTTEAKASFSESGVLWAALLTYQPQSEEYQEGANWCRQRIKELE